MKFQEFLAILDARQINRYEPSNDIQCTFASDMMSEVLTLQESDIALLTTLSNPQVIRTAEMQDLACVCFTFDKTPTEDTIKLAEEKNIPIVCTSLCLFEACGKLYEAGMRGGKQR
ncbi:MAG: hypothetical protein PF693_18065 [Spirochaetia bacterium]|jgi:CO dehydrogenase/acetyl-CoA synthase epsilon subunit|nr:hypothetical protein [Spirochaetia bacterium]